MLVELVKGDHKAIVVLAIGDEFERYFNENIKILYIEYCLRYNIGLILVNSVINQDVFNEDKFRYKVWLQTLFVPGVIKDNFINYKYLAFMDADCIPSPVARNIFDWCNLSSNSINLTRRSPFEFSKGNVGRRASLLRRLYLDSSFPLDSLLSSEHEDDVKIFALEYDHPTSTIGTIVGHIDVITKVFNYSIDSLLINYRGYTQFNLNEASVKCAEVNFLPYEFQAIWSTEVSLYYPFFFIEQSQDVKNKILQSVLLRVDFLHFAGSGIENDIFGKDGAFALDTDLDAYAKHLPQFLDQELKINSYGPIKMNYKK